MNVIWKKGGTGEVLLSDEWRLQFDTDVDGPITLYNHGGEVGFGWYSNLGYGGERRHWAGAKMLIKWKTLQDMDAEKLCILVTGIVFGHQSTLGGSDEL